MLLARPPFAGRRIETLNDLDGWLVNAWRAIRRDPGAVADAAYGPIAEIDYHARLAWLQERRGPDLVSWLEGDPENHDAKAAGWWLYVMACGIGDPFGKGPWRVVDGHLRKVGGNGFRARIPHLGDAGKGVGRELPHLGNLGRGVNRELPIWVTAARVSTNHSARRGAIRLPATPDRIPGRVIETAGTGTDHMWRLAAAAHAKRYWA